MTTLLLAVLTSSLLSSRPRDWPRHLLPNALALACLALALLIGAWFAKGCP